MVEFPTKKQTWESMRKQDMVARIRELEAENARLREAGEERENEKAKLQTAGDALAQKAWHAPEDDGFGLEPFIERWWKARGRTL